MSWLYIVFFTGLVFSGGGSNVTVPQIVTGEAPAVVRQDETEKFDKTFPLNSSGRVSISNVNGSIVIEAWDRSEVRVEYTKTASSKDHLDDVEVKINSQSDRLEIETSYDNWKTRDGQNWRTGKLIVDYHLMVPRTAFLNEVETVNGSVTVSNFTNFTKISAVNGEVKASNLRGAANLSTVNGEVAADFDRLETGSKISLSTVNGKVNLLIPSDSSATINADSLNGDITNDFGLPIRKGKYVGRDLYGRIGTGDVRIKLDSVNGGLTIGRKNDGKTPSPATNLLQQKEKDDEDWDSDSDDEGKLVNKVRMNKDAEKAVWESQKETAKAMKAARKEIVKIDPQINQITADSIAAAADAVSSAAVIINSKEVQQQINEAMAMQRDARVRMASDAFFTYSLPVVKVKSQTYSVKGVPRVTIDAAGCSVRVRGWDRSDVEYRVTQLSDPRNAEPIDVSDAHTDSVVNIKVQNANYSAREGDFSDRSRRAIVEVFVPRKSDLTIKTNGEIRVDGVSGQLDLTGGDESINVRDADGFLHVANSDGRIRVIGFNGEVIAETSDGDIELEGNFKKLSATGSDGSILLTLPESVSADLEANHPEIEGDGIDLTLVKTSADKSLYRLGNGGSKYTVRTGGEIHVRGAGTISEDN